MPTEPNQAKDGQHVLLLQGPSSRFFAHLGRALQARGMRVTRVMFNPGDRLYWSRAAGQSLACSVPAHAYGGWIETQFERLKITDMVCLGDSRFYHAEAIEAARRVRPDQRLHVIELGLLRRYGILHDPDGTGARSSIPERFAADTGGRPLEMRAPPAASFLRYVAMDVGYHLANTGLGWWLTPHYVPPMPLPQWHEYGGWLGKLPSIPARRRADRRVMARLDQLQAPLMLLPLQLAMDAQIRVFGRGKSMQAWLAHVVSSFAAHAPPHLHMLIKRHPLDNGLIPWATEVANLARTHGLGDRLIYAEHLDMAALLPRMSGVVTVNSTAGLEAVLAGVPCQLLGEACFDLPGLTSRTGLDAFWAAPKAVDLDKARAFEAFLQRDCHVPGAFDGPGARQAAAGLADKIRRQA